MTNKPDDANNGTTVHFTDEQQRIYNAARDKMHQHPWFTDVSIDGFPSTGEINLMGFNEAVDQVCAETRAKYAPEPGED